MNLVLAETNAVGLATRYTYDLAGNRLSRLDAKSQTALYAYDKVNNLLRVAYPDGVTNRYSYDGNRNLTNMVDALGACRYTYDAMNRQVRSVDHHGYAVSNQYSLKGLRTALVYPDGKTVNYFYDPANRLTNVTDWASRKTSYSFNNADALTGITFPNGVTAGYTLDDTYRTIGYAYQKAGSNLVARTITRNALGHKTKEVITAGLEGLPSPQTVQSRSYDGADRITNILARAAPDAEPGLAELYYHDANGNVVSNSAGLAFVYDFENRLTSVTSATSAVQMSYDAAGDRTRRVAGGVGRRHVLDRAARLHNVLMQTDTNGNAVAFYVWGPNGLLGLVQNDGTAFFCHGDELGSTLALSDTNGLVTDQWFFDPYGSLIARNGTTENPFTFIGGAGVFEDAAGLYHMKARYYSSDLKRFLSADPIGYQGGLNLYAYGANNPANVIDPTGLAPNQQGVTDPSHVLQALTQDPSMGNLRDTHGGNQNRYFYTDKYGWVDIRHFAEAGRMSENGWGWWTETLGFGNEVVQWFTEWGDSYRSGFSPEDLPSNSAGADFGTGWLRKMNSAEAFRLWMKDAGARNLSDIQDKVKALPLTDPSVRGGKGRGSNTSSEPRK